MDRKNKLLSILKDSGSQGREELGQMLGEEVSNSTLLRDLAELEAEGLVQRTGEGKSTQYSLTPKALENPNLFEQFMQNRHTKFQTNPSANFDDPIIAVTVNNPLTAFKRWLQKLLDNEGIELKFSLKIKPLTAIGIVLIITALSLGLTTFGVMLKHLPFYSHIQEFVTRPDNSRQTAMRGYLVRQEPSGVYYLFSQGAAEAVVIDSSTLDLSKLINQELIVSGRYNRETNRFQVEQVSQMLY